MFSRTLRPQILFALAAAFLACLGYSFSSTQAADPKKPFVLGNMIDPFTPPTLAELEKTVEWIDQPVLDSLLLMRERQKAEKPLATVAEALALKNTTPETNAKILSTLGRLPPDDKDVNFDSTINRHSGGDVNTLNPILGSSIIESDVSGLTGIGLFGFDWNLNPFATKDSVVSWKNSKDGMYDKVVMRNDMTWSDGKPITAHDIVFSFKAIMTSQVPVTAQRSGTDKLKWIEAYDDYTLVFFHKESLATNIWNLNFPIVPKHIYEPTIAADPTLQESAAHLKLEEKPVVGGPYVVTSRTRGQEIVLQRRDEYAMHQGKQVRDKPYFKTIRFRIRPDAGASLLAMKAGDIDEMILNPEQWRNQTNSSDFYKDNTKAFGLEWTEFHFIWNCSDPRFTDKRVRQALSWAFDHDELLKKRRFGMDEPCTGIFHSSSRWAPKPSLKPYTQNTEKAEALLAEAGWEDTDNNGILDKKINGKKVEFEFTVLTSNRPERIETCNLLKESLDGLGIRVIVKAMDFPVLITKMTAHEFQAAFGGWGSGADPYTTENIFKTGEERNYGLYSNPEVDKLFAAGVKEFNLEKRAAIYQKIHTLLYEDQPYTWLYYQSSYYGFNKNLRGYVFSPRGPYHYGPGFSSIWKPIAP